MAVPENLKYTKDHEWALVTGEVVRIGITDYAQDALGDIVYVGLPGVGSAVSAGASFAEVESTKSVSDIYAPVGGVISAVNDALANAPELLNQDPFGAGWICEITVMDGAATDGLLSAEAYSKLIEA